MPFWRDIYYKIQIMKVKVVVEYGTLSCKNASLRMIDRCSNVQYWRVINSKKYIKMMFLHQGLKISRIFYILTHTLLEYVLWIEEVLPKKKIVRHNFANGENEAALYIARNYLSAREFPNAISISFAILI